MSDSQRCARVLVGQLIAQGVHDVVLAPGSRSAPLALCLHAAAQAGLLRLHVRIDERSAGFLALGLAKASGAPVAVVTTSGTAVGNLLPAVMEAHHAGVPLIVVSADRPSWVVGFGANQTTKQVALFNEFVAYSARVVAGAPEPSWRAQASRAVLLATGATGGRRGPVQLNLELTEPLVGDQEWLPVAAEPVRAEFDCQAPVVHLPGTPRTLVLCGDATAEVGAQAVALAEQAGLPLVAEPSSNARRGTNALVAGRLLLATELGDQIERVIVFGRPTLSRPVSALLARPGIEVVVVADRSDFVDPGWQAVLVVGAVAVELGAADWLQAWRGADAERAAAIRQDEQLPTAVSGPQLAAAVVGSVGPAGILCLGNSNAIRDADLAPIAGAPRCYANRGLAGIDGTISTAVGIALASNTPTTLLCGDVSFVHDSAGLLIAAGEPRPQLRIVVADDDGGSIFATLEYGQPEFASAFERVFATPTGIDLVALARAYGVNARRLSSIDEVSSALAEPPHDVEVLVVDVDRAGRAALNERLRHG